MLFIDIFVLLLIGTNFVHLEICKEADLTLTYTECDNSGHRWLINVPKSNASCKIDKTKLGVPRKARNCGDPCTPGTFLNKESQNCEDCPSGTYSSGDSIEIDSWEEMPSSFYTESQAEDEKSQAACKKQEWKPMKDYISSKISNCAITLSFAVNLHKEGFLQFFYQMPDDDIFFQIKIINDDCSSNSKGPDKKSRSQSQFLESSGPNHWRDIKMTLSRGHNTINWFTMGLVTHQSEVKIRSVFVTNAIYSMECTKCPVGYFSSGKSSKCSQCEMNTYSNTIGSSKCITCKADQYSFPGSKECLKRKACSSQDYTYKWTDCDENQERSKVFYWIEPKLCYDQAVGSIQLPKSIPKEKCDKCPPGTHIFNGTKCSKCPHNTVTNRNSPSDPCVKCPINTRAINEIQYNHWTRHLPHLKYRCLKNDKTCKRDEIWIMDNDQLRSNPSFDINILQLNFVPREDDSSASLDQNSPNDKFRIRTTLSFEFSMNCSRFCILHLFMSHQKSTSTVNTWTNSTEKHVYKFNVYSKDPGHFVWVFSRDSYRYQKNQDSLSIYSIKMSNLHNAGGVRCQYCSQQDSTNCNDCEQGKYYSQSDNKCQLCPENHILANYPGLSLKDCLKCSNGLISLPTRTLCVPNPLYNTPSGVEYDLRKLSGPHLISSDKLFNRRGQQYQYLLNISLFVDNYNQLSRCINNISKFESFDYENGPACRVTVVKGIMDNSTYYSLQPIGLADHYESIIQSNSSIDYWSEINQTLSKHGFPKDEMGTDLHLKMKVDAKTDACKDGRTVVITLHCNPTVVDSPRLNLPPKCPIGTCDGCNFHLFMDTVAACPFCRPGPDYTLIKEECYNGNQLWHYQPARWCQARNNFQLQVWKKCPILTPQLKIAGIVTFVILVFMIALVAYCYNKNKKLEYKYMRLVGGSNVNENSILPGAESCGMNDDDDDEDDEDEDKVKFKNSNNSNKSSIGRPSKKLFAKFNKKKRHGYGDTEQLQMYDGEDDDNKQGRNSPDFDI